MVLGELSIGARLVLRCRKDWREAVVAYFTEEKAVLSVHSKTGKTYRVRRPLETEITFEADGTIPVLNEECEENDWRGNLIKYDLRW